MPPIPSVTAIVSRIEKPEAGDTDDSLRAFLGAFTAKELRSACKNFHVKVRTKNANMDNKVGYQTMLVQLSHARRESEEAESDQRDKMLQGSEGQLVQALASTRKTRHCSFRLVNILFSEKFCDRLGSMGTQPKRRELDAGAVGGNNAFWKEVAVEYSNDREEYGRLVPRDGRFDAIDPGHIVLHDSEKLKQMWKDISAKYAAAHARAMQSGSHESDFYDFCNGQIEALYVSVWLIVRPQAFNAAVGSMPKHCQVDTLNGSSPSEDILCTKSTPSKKRRSEATEMITYLETRFGTTEEKKQEQVEEKQYRKRARVFSELEHLTKSLCALKQTGMDASIVERMEAKVNEYMMRVDGFDSPS